MNSTIIDISVMLEYSKPPTSESCSRYNQYTTRLTGARWKTVRCDGQHSVTCRDRLMTRLSLGKGKDRKTSSNAVEHGKSGTVQRSEVPFFISCLEPDM